MGEVGLCDPGSSFGRADEEVEREQTLLEVDWCVGSGREWRI